MTTMAGLAVAIPVLVFYYYFAGRVEQSLADMNDAAGEFMEHFARDQETAA